MKKYRIFVFPVLLALFVWSCEIDQLLKYDRGETFIAVTAPYNESTLRRNLADFGIMLPSLVMEARVHIAGDVADYDRPISFSLVEPHVYIRHRYRYVVDENGDFVYDDEGNRVEERYQFLEGMGATPAGGRFPLMEEGVDVELLPSYIPAGATYGLIQVRVYNTELLNSPQYALAAVALNANEYFRNDFVNDSHRGTLRNTRFHFFARYLPGVPRLWRENTGYHFTMTFGPHSFAKQALIVEVTGIDPDLFDRPGTLMEVVGGERAALRAMAWSVQLVLNAYMDANDGREMVDEIGNPIRMHPDIAASIPREGGG